MSRKLINLFKRSPETIQGPIRFLYHLIPVPLRYGRVFREYSKRLEETQWYSQSQLEELQVTKLRHLIKHVYENVPYYSEMLRRNKLKPEDIKQVDDIRKVPMLSKDDIRRNFINLIARNMAESKRHYLTTGGSTGTPLSLCWEHARTWNIEEAFVWRQWNWANVGYRDKGIILR